MHKSCNTEPHLVPRTDRQRPGPSSSSHYGQVMVPRLGRLFHCSSHFFSLSFLFFPPPGRLFIPRQEKKRSKKKKSPPSLKKKDQRRSPARTSITKETNETSEVWGFGWFCLQPPPSPLPFPSSSSLIHHSLGKGKKAKGRSSASESSRRRGRSSPLPPPVACVFYFFFETASLVLINLGGERERGMDKTVPCLLPPQGGTYPFWSLL